jgi:hypothetical protein
MRGAKMIGGGLLSVAALAAVLSLGDPWRKWYPGQAGNAAPARENEQNEVSAVPGPLDTPTGRADQLSKLREDDALWCRISPAAEMKSAAEGGPEIVVELTNISDDPVDVLYPPHKPTDHLIWEVGFGSGEMDSLGFPSGGSPCYSCASPSVLRLEAGRTFSDRVPLFRILALQGRQVVPGTYRLRASCIRVKGVIARSEPIEVTLAGGAR